MVERSRRVCLLVGATLAWACGASAQAANDAKAPPGASDAVGLEEIVVTAQKREEALSQVGMSITAISGDTLVRRNITDAQDLVRVVPGFTYATSALNTPVYSIRGVGFNDSTLAASPTVSIYVDQVALPYAAMTQGATLDLERLEVLKGPQGTLFGQNATAGAINFIARKPTDTFEAGLTGSYSRFNDADVQGFVSGPLGDSVRARLAASHTSADGWQRSLTRPGDTLGAIDRSAARFTLDWDATPDLTFSFNANGWIDKSDGQAGQLVQVVFGSPNPAFHLPSVANAPIAPHDDRLADWDPNRRPHRDDRFYQLSLRGDWRLGDAATLTSITSYNHYRTHSAQDPDGIAASNAEFILDGEIRAFNEELRMSGDADRLHWLFGGTYSRDRIRDDQPLQDYPTSSGAQSVAGVHILDGGATSRQSVDSWAAFASGEYRLTDQFKALAGVRYTKENRDFTGCARDAGDGLAALAFGRLQAALSGGKPSATPFTVGGCITLGPPPNFSATEGSATLDEDNVAWNVGLNYNPVESALIYARVSKGYKSGSFPTLSYTSVEQFRPVTQESVLAYETGFKTTLLDRRLRVDGAVFYYDYTNKQLKGKQLIPPFGALNALQNVPKSWVKGAEFSATAEPVRGLTLSGAATYIDTRVTQFVGYDPSGVLRDLAGIQFNFSPHWELQADATYEWDVSPQLRGWVGADVVHHSSATSALGGDSTYDLNAYTLLDLQAGVRASDGSWRVSVWGKNVTDAFYATNVIRFVDTVARFTGQPATYGVTVGLAFK